MSYLQFHLVFTLPLFFFMLFLNRKNPLSFSKKSQAATLLLCVLAFSYTTPWDSYLIRENIWNYQPGRVLGTWLAIPFEEYFFFIIQTIIGCLFTSLICRSFLLTQKNKLHVSRPQWILALSSFPVALGLFLYFEPQNQFRYLWLVAVWALPVLLLQWMVGLSVLWKEKKSWLLSVAGLCSYFWIADGIAIAKGIWSFPEGTISGLHFLSLPLEEALFFLVTNLMVVQGYILFTSVDFKSSDFGFWRAQS